MPEFKPERSESHSETYFVTSEIFTFWNLLHEHIQQVDFAEFLKKAWKAKFHCIGQRFHSLQQAACVTGWESVLRFRTSNLIFGTRRVMSFPELCVRAGKLENTGFLYNQLYLKAREMTHYGETQLKYIENYFTTVKRIPEKTCFSQLRNFWAYYHNKIL